MKKQKQNKMSDKSKDMAIRCHESQGVREKGNEKRVLL